MSVVSAWPLHLRACLARGEPAVLVVVARARGSTPREAGAAMLVTSAHAFETIGGGNLEWQAIRTARALLATADPTPAPKLQSLALGPHLAQCCGGRTDLLYWPTAGVDWAALDHTGTALCFALRPGVGARVTASHASNIAFTRAVDGFTLILPRPAALPHVALFGAGHVGQAVIGLLKTLPCTVGWYDPRPGLMPQQVTPHIASFALDDVPIAVASVPIGGDIIIMSHSHDLDYAVCAEALARADLGLIGLIGSATKRARFSKRLAAQGLDPERLTCPIGLPAITGKHPSFVAVAVVAQLSARWTAQEGNRDAIATATENASP